MHCFLKEKILQSFFFFFNQLFYALAFTCYWCLSVPPWLKEAGKGKTLKTQFCLYFNISSLHPFLANNFDDFLLLLLQHLRWSEMINPLHPFLQVTLTSDNFDGSLLLPLLAITELISTHLFTSHSPLLFLINLSWPLMQSHTQWIWEMKAGHDLQNLGYIFGFDLLCPFSNQIYAEKSLKLSGPGYVEQIEEQCELGTWIQCHGVPCISADWSKRDFWRHLMQSRWRFLQNCKIKRIYLKPKCYIAILLALYKWSKEKSCKSLYFGQNSLRLLLGPFPHIHFCWMYFVGGLFSPWCPLCHLADTILVRVMVALIYRTNALIHRYKYILVYSYKYKWKYTNTQKQKHYWLGWWW